MCFHVSVDRILNKPTSTYVPPYRPSSPLVSRYTRPWSPTRSEIIAARVDRALARNRSLDRLNVSGLHITSAQLKLHLFSKWLVFQIPIMCVKNSCYSLNVCVQSHLGLMYMFKVYFLPWWYLRFEI